MKRVPVFFINGFLDSGKTTFIIDTIKGDGFNGKTLLLVCEEGEVEYDARMMKALYKTDIEYFESFEYFDYKKIDKMLEEYNPDRVVIEMNGMWEVSKLQFPKRLDIMQVIYFIDTNTFSTYFNNMRQQMTNMIQKSHVVAFINCKDKVEQLEPYKSALRMINSNAQFMILNSNMVAEDAFEEPLPYDITKEVIEIETQDFGTFYIDTFDHKDNYQDKVVSFIGQVFTSKKLPKGTFIIGRKVMNCCADDIQLCGFLVKSCLNHKIEDRSFVKIKARAKYEFSKEYNEEELMLDPIEITKVESLVNEVLDLTNPF